MLRRRIAVAIVVSLLAIAVLLLIDFSSSFVSRCLTGDHYNNNYTKCARDYQRSLYSGLIISGFALLGRFGPEVWTAIATFVVAGFTFTLWRATDRLFAATKDTAQAALRQANAVVAMESPLPVIAGVKLVQYANRVSTDFISDPVSPGPVPAFCRVLINFTNLGRSPMHVDGFSIEWEVSHSQRTERRYRNDIRPWTVWLPEKQSLWFRADPECEITLTADQHQKINNWREYLWVYGRVLHSNFMKEAFIFGFCFKWNISTGFERMEDPTYYYEESAGLS